MEIRFIADSNVGKLARWLRIMGYDALFFNNIDDDRLIDIALKEKRIVLTRDTQIMRRRVVTNGQMKVILLQTDNPEEQLRQVVKELKLDYHLGQFTRCLECNQSLLPKTKEEMKDLVPPYVFRTQNQYMQCPSCRRIYWRGTHWQRMKKELERLTTDKSGGIQ
jgi:uncharacterized protein with PIN domain